MIAWVLLGTATAWEPSFATWSPRDQPVVLEVVDDPDDPARDAVRLAEVRRALMRWQDADTCATFGAEAVSVGSSFHQGATFDRVPRVVSGDPDDVLPTGILAFTDLRWNRNRITRFVGDRRMKAMVDADIVLNDGVTWVDEDVGQDCGGHTWSSVMSHEVGHLLGLAHSCTEGATCPPEAEAATMNWRVPTCDTARGRPNADDAEGFAALYGPWLRVDCSHAVDPDAQSSVSVGTVPLSLKCAVSSGDRGRLDVTWDWGDGATSSGVDGTHVYTSEGLYDLSVCGSVDRPGCDGWSRCVELPGKVRACDVPTPRFEAELVEGGVRVRNETSVAVEGCATAWRWTVEDGRGAEASFEAWEGTWPLDGPSPHTVTLHVGGPAGTGAASAVVGAGGCTVTGGAAGTWLVLWALGVSSRRRGSSHRGRRAR